jgi:hypothetical protein
MRARMGEHTNAIAAGFEAGECLRERKRHVTIDGVAFLGTVERDDGNAITGFVKKW